MRLEIAIVTKVDTKAMTQICKGHLKLRKRRQAGRQVRRINACYLGVTRLSFVQFAQHCAVKTGTCWLLGYGC
jgi:hypothetical protein